MVAPHEFLTSIMTSGLEKLELMGGPPRTPDANRLLLAIALQESGPQLSARYQNSPSASPGPARGFWQFEQGGGAAGVLQHNTSKDLAKALCRAYVIVDSPAAVWRALEGHDELAVGFARLLLFTDPRPLPTTESAAWDYYIRNWRPGKPHPQNWTANWSTADRTIRNSLIA